MTSIVWKEYNLNINIIYGKRVRRMDVQQIPIPSAATIKVSKEGKSALFDTTVIHTSENKYIYVVPIHRDNKLVSFTGQGLIKEIKIRFGENEVYVWRNISITKFIEEGKLFLRIHTRTPGIHANVRQNREQAVGS